MEKIIIKKDTSENWNKAKNFIPQKDEIIMYAENNKIKIGDGKTKLSKLLFVNDFYNYLFEDDTLIIEKGG